MDCIKSSFGGSTYHSSRYKQRQTQGGDPRTDCFFLFVVEALGFLRTPEDSPGPAVARTGATLSLSSSSFLYGDEVTITEVSALRFRFLFCCLTGSEERAAMPFVFTTAMTSDFPGLGVGPGVSDRVGRSVASPSCGAFCCLTILWDVLLPHHLVGRSVASPSCGTFCCLTILWDVLLPRHLVGRSVASPSCGTFCCLTILWDVLLPHHLVGRSVASPSCGTFCCLTILWDVLLPHHLVGRSVASPSCGTFCCLTILWDVLLPHHLVGRSVASPSCGTFCCLTILWDVLLPHHFWSLM